MANIIGTLVSDLIIPGGNIQGEPLPDLSGDDIIDGVGGDNVIAGSDGNDSIVGRSGRDMLFGNQGEDTLEAGGGDDSLYGGQDNDVIRADLGNNYLAGDLGNDSVFGGSGNDFIVGGEGDDCLDGGAGDNTIAGEDGNDTLQTAEGNDVLFGNQGNDVIQAGNGDNTLYGGAGADTLEAGAGSNVLFGDLGADVLVGGEGQDSFAMARRSDNITTGGEAVTDADRIQNFVRGQDKLMLDGLPFADVSIEVNGENSIIKDTVTNQFLAVVEGVSDLDATDFSSDIADPEPPRTFEFVDENGELVNLYEFNQQDGGSTAGELIPRSIFVKRSGTTGEDELLFNKIPATALEGRDFEGPGSDVELLNGQRVVSFADGEGTVSFDINLINEVLGTDAVEGGDRFFSLQLRQDNIVVDNANFLIQRGSAAPSPGGGFTFGTSGYGDVTENTGTVAGGLLRLTASGQEILRFTVERADASVASEVSFTTAAGTDADPTTLAQFGSDVADFREFSGVVPFAENQATAFFDVPVAFDGDPSSIIVTLSENVGEFPEATVNIL